MLRRLRHRHRMRRLRRRSYARELAAMACAVAALGVASCQRQNASENHVGAGLDAAFTHGECAAIPPFDAPAVGTIFSGRLTAAGGANLDIEVRSTSGASVAYSPTIVLNNGVKREIGRRAAYFGFLYDRDHSGPERVFDYRLDPSELYNLRPGQRREFGVTERLTGERGTASVDHRFNVELIACGRLRWSGREVPVKVFKADIANASINREGQLDGAARDVFVAYLAPQYGWSLLKVYADGGREEVLRIDPPE